MLPKTLCSSLVATTWRRVCVNRTSTVSIRGLHTVVAAKHIADSATVRSTDSQPWSKAEPFQHVYWRSPSKTKGTIRFFGLTKDGKPAMLNFKKGEEDQTNFGPSLEKVVDVTDLRNFEPPTSLGFEGIEWVYAPSVLSEDKLLAPLKSDVEAFVRGPYFQECAQLVKDKKGAARSIAYNFRHRRIEEVWIKALSSIYIIILLNIFNAGYQPP